MIKIELPLFDSKYVKIAEPIAHTLELFNSHLCYKFEAYMDKYPNEEDESKGWIGVKEAQYQKIHLTLLRSACVCVESSFNADTEKWHLVFEYTTDNLHLKFEKEKEMRKVESQLLEWWLY